MTSYTGFQDVRTGSVEVREVDELLGFISALDRLTGRPLKHKAIDHAHSVSERIDSLRNARQTLATNAADALVKAGQDFANGKADPEDIARMAVDVATINASGPEVTRFLNEATRSIEREAIAKLAKLGESVWLSTLKPRAEEVLTEARALADLLYHDPTPQAPGEIRAGNLYAPSRIDVENNMELRHQWERLEAVLEDLDALHSYADELRNFGFVPTVEGREFAEDYRWKHAGLLDGRPAEVREFFLANYKIAEPGLFTADELNGASTPHSREQGADRFTHALLHNESWTDDNRLNKPRQSELA